MTSNTFNDLIVSW